MRMRDLIDAMREPRSGPSSSGWGHAAGRTSRHGSRLTSRDSAMEVGWSPSISLDEAAVRTVAWWREQAR